MSAPLRFETPDGELVVAATACVVAGWTGRDRAALDHHIEELAAIGVPGPSAVPLFYRVGVEQLTQSDRIQVLGGESSGEVEPVLVASERGLYLTVGSDHTDRQVEAYSIPVSKQMCPKILALSAWPIDLEDDLDALELDAWARIAGLDTQYQHGNLGMIRPLRDLVGLYGGLEPGTVMLCGTVPVSGKIRPADRLSVTLTDSARGRAISHTYEIDVLPVVS